MLNYITAETEMRQHFLSYWQEKCNLLIGYVPDIQWNNVQERDKTLLDKHWGRFTSRNAITKQTSLAGSRNAFENTKDTTFGICVLQLFISKIKYATLTHRTLADIAKTAFMRSATPNGIWFKNGTIKDLEPEADWIRTNVIVEFEYDTLRV